MSDELGQTLDQRRARHAWEAVARMSERPGKLQNAYRREAKRLPVRTLTAGLGQALAFLNAKRSEAHDELLRDVADWVLNKREGPKSVFERPKAGALIEKIVEGNGVFLRIAVDEVLAYTRWLNRFSEAELEDEEG